MISAAVSLALNGKRNSVLDIVFVMGAITK